MKNRYRLFIFIALVSVVAVSFVLRFFLTCDDLLINLATEVIGIIVTVFIVELIINHNEKRRWKVVYKRLETHMYLFFNIYITGIRNALGIQLDLYPFMRNSNLKPSSTEEISRKYLKKFREEYEDKLYQALNEASEATWENFITTIIDLHNATISFQSMYNSIIDPDEINTVGLLNDSFHKLITLYKLCGDILRSNPVDTGVIKKNESIVLKEVLLKDFCERLVDVGKQFEAYINRHTKKDSDGKVQQHL